MNTNETAILKCKMLMAENNVSNAAAMISEVLHCLKKAQRNYIEQYKCYKEHQERYNSSLVADKTINDLQKWLSVT